MSSQGCGEAEHNITITSLSACPRESFHPDIVVGDDDDDGCLIMMLMMVDDCGLTPG